MTNEEKKQKIEEIYETARQKLLELEARQKEVIAQYFKEIDQKKMEALRQEITNLF